MTTDQFSGKGIKYTLEDKFFWAAVFNLARHNAFITINHINQQLGIKPIENDQDINSIKISWNASFDSENLERKAKLYALINKHFPFLIASSYGQRSYEVMSSIPIGKNGRTRLKSNVERKTEQADSLDLKMLLDLLIVFIEKLRDFRNYYSHYKHSKQNSLPKLDVGLMNRLYDIFDSNVRMVKQDHKHNTKIDPRKDFDHLIRKSKSGVNPKFKSHFANGEEITEAGLLFFASIFLEKKDAIWIQRKIFGFKGSNQTFMQMTNEVFCRTRILLPKLRLESNYDNDQLLLEMLGELAKCPKTFFDRLSENDRQKFMIPIEIYDFENDESIDNDPFKNILVRHHNRFSYFALRYFDLNNVFKDLRFQIDLGNYHFSIYDKKIGDQIEKRHLTRNLFSFGRIQSFDEVNLPLEWKNLVRDLDYYESSDLPFISKTTPHYHLVSNKIGLKFANYDSKWPGLEITDAHERKAKYVYDNQFVADGFLSVYELVPMMFYYLLTEDGQKVEGVLKSTKEKAYKIFEEFQEYRLNSIQDLKNLTSQTNIHPGQLPKRLINILNDTEKNLENEARRKISILIENTEKRIKQLHEQTNQKIRIGKPNNGLLKPGKIADWLIKDLMRFQPVAFDQFNQPLNRSKANSTEYQLLQKTFALYGSEKDRLPAYLRQLNLVGSNNPHAFLSEFNWANQSNLLSFYEAYLTARLIFLQKLNVEKWMEYQYFLLLRTKKTDRNKLVAGWKNGFNFPRGLFTQPIKEWFAKFDSGISKEIENYESTGLIARVIPLFFEKKYNDSAQAFYSFDFNIGNPEKPKDGVFLSKSQREDLWKITKSKLRLDKDSPDLENTIAKIEKAFEDINYSNIDWNIRRERLHKLIHELNIQDKVLPELEKRNSNLKLKTKISEAASEKFRETFNFRKWQGFEKELRLYKNQDMLIWLLCRNLRTDSQLINLNINNLYLKNIDTDVHSTQSLNILNRVLPMKLSIPIYPTDEKGNVFKKMTPTVVVQIEEKETKVLKHGNFKALVKDRRLNNLFTFIDAGPADFGNFSISKKRIEAELAKYQVSRIEVFKITLEIEKNIVDAYPNLPTDNFRELLGEWLNIKVNQSELRCFTQILVSIRNAFAHNQYPRYCDEKFGSINRFNISNPNTAESNGLNIAIQLLDLATTIKSLIIKEL